MGFFLEPLYTPAYKIAGDEVAVFTTNKGVIRAKLDGEGAPIHVANFCELAESGEDVAAGKIGEDGMPGTGGPGYRIKHEYDTNPRNSHEDGALAMARAQNPDSAGSQFYFCLGAQHFLDRGYTVFGQTVEGKDVVDSLRAGDVIESIRIEHAAD